MKTKHTPGPWILHGALARIEDVNGRLLAVPVFQSQNDTGTTYGSNENLANAKLIAAAPELLEALKETLFLLQGYAVQYGHAPTLDKKIKTAKEAIKKATE